MKNYNFIKQAVLFSFATLFLFSCSEENITVEPTTSNSLSSDMSEMEILNLKESYNISDNSADYDYYLNLMASAVEPSECSSEGIAFKRMASSCHC